METQINNSIDNILADRTYPIEGPGWLPVVEKAVDAVLAAWEEPHGRYGEYLPEQVTLLAAVAIKDMLIEVHNLRYCLSSAEVQARRAITAMNHVSTLAEMVGVTSVRDALWETLEGLAA